MRKILVIAIIIGFNSFAQARKPVGAAGCGLGNVLLGKENQIVASTINGSSIYTQTFAIFSGTSNCVDEEGNAKLEGFIEANPVALANDIARGEGQTLAGLTSTLKCSKPTEVHGMLKNNYKRIYRNGTHDSAYIGQEVRELIKANQTIGEGCRG